MVPGTLRAYLAGGIIMPASLSSIACRSKAYGQTFVTALDAAEFKEKTSSFSRQVKAVIAQLNKATRTPKHTRRIQILREAGKMLIPIRLHEARLADKLNGRKERWK